MVRNGLILYIKKRSFPEWLALFIFIMPLLLPTLIQFLHLPGFTKYLVDFAYVIGVTILALNRRVEIRKEQKTIFIYIAVYFFTTAVVYLFHFQSILYYLWGVRNLFRFYFFFVLLSVFLDYEDSFSCLDLLDIVFWVNAIVTFFQFFVLGYGQDYLGGIFGVERGSNASTLIFFSIIVSKALLNFMNHKESIVSVLLKCTVALLISSLAELKVFFVVCILITVVSAIITKASWKKIVLIVLITFAVPLFGSILPILYGESSNITFKRIAELIFAQNYATSEDLGRFTAIPTISKTILDNLPLKMFGLGLGNCDTSTYDIFITPFYKEHFDLHYTWFSSAFIYLETGYVGLMINLWFYISCMFFAAKNIQRKCGQLIYNQLSIVIAILCIVFTFYNASLRTEAGYLVYFVLALPYIGMNKSVYVRHGD